jgi:peptide/nickel transport system substrate-binding protein
VRVHRGKAILAGIAAIALGLTACSSSGGGGSSNTSGTKGTGILADCGKNPNTCNTGDTKPGGTFTYTLEKVIYGWNVNSGNSSTFEQVEVLDGLLPGAFTATPDLKPFPYSDYMDSAEETSTSPQTLVYKIKQNAVWSDGKPIDASDFQYQWDTSDLTRCPKCAPASTAGYKDIKSLTASDNGKTVTVVMSKPFADWQSMFGTLYPAHIAAEHGDINTPAGRASTFNWFDTTVPTWSGGPYKIVDYKKDTSVTEVPNPNWFGATKPSLDKLIFRIITDQNQEPPALQNGDVNALYAQPNQDMVTKVGGYNNVSTYLGKGLNWEHFDFNVTNPLLKDQKLRLAIFTAIDRQAIIDRTVGLFVPGITTLGNHIYVPGQAGYQDNVTDTGQGAGKVDDAKKILTDAGYKGVGTNLTNPSGAPVKFRCTFTVGNTLREQTCKLVATQLKQLGITMTLDPTDDLGGSLEDGKFDLIIFAWVGTPFVVAGAQQIWELKGGGDYGKNDDPKAEALINQAASQTDPGKVQDLMNQADKLITADAYSLPLFQKPTYLATVSTVANIRDNATSVGPPYNVSEWGYKAS